MLTKDIIDDIKVRYPNGYSDDQLIKWINQSVEENWEDLALDDVWFTTLNADQQTYTLPDSIDFSGIIAVFVDEKELKAQSIPDFKAINTYFKEIEGQITITPKPIGGEQMTIYYLHKPEKVTAAEDDLKVRPQFVEIIKNNIFIIIAKAAKEVDLANNYVADFNAALEDARQRKSAYSAAYPKVRETKNK